MSRKASKSGMFQACTLGPKDTIQVDVENCTILDMRRVPGQLKNRSAYLVEVTVVPNEGPWRNIEGKFVVESTDLISVVSRHRAPSLLQQVCLWIKDKIVKPKAVPLPQITHKESAPWS